MISICILPDLTSAAKHAALVIHDSLAKHRGEHRFTLALSGGSTPRAIYSELRVLPEIANLLSDRAEIFFSDERAVQPDNPQSNYGLARANLIIPLGLPPERVHRIRGEAADLAQEADRYAHEISTVTGCVANSLPRLDLIMLGMGADGHTASLFPGGSWIKTDEPVVATAAPDTRMRLSMNVNLLNRGRLALFVATGAEKAPAVKKVLSADNARDILPARMIDASRTIWILDHAAAADLNRTNLRGTIETC